MCREARQRGNVAFYLLKGRASEAASLLNVGVAPDILSPLFAKCLSQQTNGFEMPLSTLSALSKDQTLPCRFHHIFGDGTLVVDLQNALDLHQQTVHDAKVASCNA
jgi:hypothetical protein